MNPVMLYEIPTKPPGLKVWTVGGGVAFEALQFAWHVPGAGFVG
jgi:hypothetical protein